MALTCQGSDKKCKSYGPIDCILKGGSNGCKFACEKTECPPKISVNKGFVTIYLIIVSILGLIITAMVSFTLHNHNTIQFFLFASLLLFTIWVNSMIINGNPFCIFKACLTDTDSWVPLTGLYIGSKSSFGIKVDIEIDFSLDNKVTINSLSCSDTGNIKLCPSDNILQYCGTDTKVVISDTKTDYGYPVTGECLDQIKQNTHNVFSNIWAVRKGNNIYFQILIKVGSANLNILLPLTPK